MAFPDGAPEGKVWLGTAATAEADGWHDLVPAAEYRRAQLKIFPPKVVTGDATKDSDEYLSSRIYGDFTGGIGVEEENESTDAARCWTAVADTRSPNKNSLPLLVETTTPGTSGGGFPLGDVYDTATDRATSFYAARGTAVHRWVESSDSWGSAAAVALPGVPLRIGTAFRGTATDTRLFVPCGAAGFATVTETGGTPTVAANPIATRTFLDFAVWNDAVWGIETTGKLWQSVDGSTFTAFKDFSGGSDLVLDPARLPRRLVVYFTRNGESTLFCVTDQDVWYLDFSAHAWRLTPIQYPPHPDFGLDAAVWRPGEDLNVAGGMDLVKFTSANVVVPLSGPARDDGVPREYRGKIVSLAPELSSLWALLKGDQAADASLTAIEEATNLDDETILPDSRAYSALLAWTGIGWHQLWSGIIDPTWLCVSRVDPVGDNSGYRLWWGSQAGTLSTMRLRRTFHNPRQGFLAGIDRFAESGFIETGRFDAAMLGFDKVAKRGVLFLDKESATTTEYVEVSYRTDAAPTTWTLLGRSGTSGRDQFEIDPDGDGHPEGLPFNWMQVRFDLRRGGDVTKTPIFKAFALHFVKVSQDATSHTFSVHLPKTHDTQGRTGREIVARLQAMLDLQGMCWLVHQTTRYRGMVVGLGGADASGKDFSGHRQVTFIAFDQVEAA